MAAQLLFARQTPKRQSTFPRFPGIFVVRAQAATPCVRPTRPPQSETSEQGLLGRSCPWSTLPSFSSLGHLGNVISSQDSLLEPVTVPHLKPSRFSPQPTHIFISATEPTNNHGL